MAMAPKLDHNIEGTDGFCRTCLTDLPPRDTSGPAPPRCPNCHSPRLVQPEQIAGLSIAHIDCDAFYAAIEKRDNPDLATKPVLIGGGVRGVVSTACYIARVDGVHSAMPMFQARKLCPDAVIIKPNMEKYSAAGKQVRQLMEEVTPLVQPVSIDEAFLDLTGTERLHGMVPAKTLCKLAKHIEDKVGITVSIGLSHNKFLAKMASDEDKPAGFFSITSAQTRDYLSAKPVTAIWGVGKAMGKKLNRHGITHVSQLQRMEQAELVKQYGEFGLRLYNLSRGIDHRQVRKTDVVKSISGETTFNEDIADQERLERLLWRQAERVASRAKKTGWAGYTVTLKLKDNQFKSITRSKSLHDPTQLADVIYRTAQPFLAKECTGRKYRLLGVGISNLVDPGDSDPQDLLDPDAATRAKAERAMDLVRNKFGKDAIEKGRSLSTSKQALPEQNEDTDPDPRNL